MENTEKITQKTNYSCHYDPEIPLLGTHPKKTKTPIWKGTWAPVLIAALPTIAKMWKQTNCPETVEWIKKMWFIYMIYNGILFSHKNEIMPIAATGVGLDVVISEISQREKDINRMISVICRI